MAIKATPTDGFPTSTSRSQAETETVLLEHLPDPAASTAAPVLQKNAHMQFLIRNLVQGFPTRYISQDASQPWLLFWTLQAFSVLQVALDPGNKQRCVRDHHAALRSHGDAGVWRRSWHGSTRTEDSAAVLDKRRICCQPTPRYARWPSSDAQGLEVDGIKWTGELVVLQHACIFHSDAGRKCMHSSSH